MRDNHFITRFLSLIGSFFITIFGRISWQTPTWLSFLTQKTFLFFRTKKRLAFSIIISLLLLIAAVSGFTYWYQKLPKPVLISADITAPEITPLADKLHPTPVIIDFGTQDDSDTLTPASVAPLKNIGKTVSKGITMDPTTSGRWTWQDDSTLVFYPTNDWPAGQTYKINFDKNVFAKSVKLATYSYSFSTQPFADEIEELKFYQDLTNPQQTRIVGTVNFNFPVNTQSFEQHTYLIMQQLKNDKVNLAAQRYPLTFTYDKFKRTAYLRSALINLPTVPRYAELMIEKNVQSASGTSSTTDPINTTVLIPDVGSFLQITTTNSTIARDNNDNPMQLMVIETSLGVSNAELTKHIHVYLLPKDLPATEEQSAQENYQWQEPGEVTDDILKQSTPMNLTALPEDHPNPTVHSWQFTAPTPRFIYLKIDSGVNGLGGFTLTHHYATIIQVPEIPKEINFLHAGSLMSLSDTKKLTLLVRGIPLVKFSIARVLPGEINHLVSQTSGDFQNPQFLNDDFTRNDLSLITTEKRAFNILRPNDIQYTTLDLNQYLSNQQATDQLGLFLIKAQGWDAKNDVATDVENNRLILITDMGILVKNNTDNTHDVFVQSISQGTPVANAKVSLLGRNGLPIASGETDVNGHVLLPSVSDFTDDKAPTVYLVQNGTDISFIPYDRDDRILNYSRFDISGEDNSANNQNNLSAYLFSDRGIYRPGDSIHFGMIVKQQYAQDQAAGLPLEEEITDPRGNTVLDQKVNLPNDGLMTVDYQPDTTAPTGLYTANLFLVKDQQTDNLLGSTNVRVEEFLPDRLRMQVQLIPGNNVNAKTSGWLSPTQLQAKVNLWNLYGTPATARQVRAKIILEPRELHFPQFPDDIFVDPLLNPKQPLKTYTEELTESTTNNKGEAQFNLNLERVAQGTYQLTFFAQGYEAQGGRGVSNQVSALVTPLNYLVGFKPDGNLNYLKQNSQHTVNFVAINPDLKQIPLADLQAQLLSIQNISTLIKKPDGTYAYESVQTEKPLHQHAFAIAANGSNFEVPTQTIGDFAVVISDKQGHMLSKFYYSVVGESGFPVEKNGELLIKLDKQEYQPGDTIHMQIAAPYTGAGIITLERDKVYAYQWFKTDSTNSLQSIQIPTNFRGDGYVNVAFVRDWNSDEIYLSPLSYSIVPFALSHADHAVQIKLSAPPIVKPGDNLSIQFSSDKPGKIIIFAVDQGILQVAHYITPDPLSYFFRKYALTVTTSQILDQILPKYLAERESSTPGGDGAGKELANNLNPFKRKTQAPVVYWSGILDSDNTTHSVTYSVPDYFNGNLQIMAVAVAANSVGNAQQNTTVRGDFIISPNVPTFVAPGDKFTVSAGIANNIKGSGSSTPTVVSISASSGLIISGPTQQQIIIPEGQERAVEFTLTANKKLGNASIIFHSLQGQTSGQLATTLSIRPAMPNQTSIISGTDNSSRKTIDITRQLYPEYRVLQASASTNPLILVKGLQGYLDNYPYYCTEQLISTAFSQLAIAKQPLFQSDPAQLAQYMNNTLQMLRQRLNSDGGFSYWPGVSDDDLNNFSTVYAVDYLTEAKLQGYPIPNDLLKSGLTYLKNMVEQDIDSLDKAQLDAYAIYLLTRNEIVTTNYLTHVQSYLMQQSDDQWQHEITSIYLAASYKMLKNDDEATKLIKGYSLQNTNNNSSDFNNPLINNAQYITILARHFPDILTKLGGDPIITLAQNMNNNSYFDTLAAAYSANALSAYSQMVNSPATSGISVQEKLTNGTLQTLTSINAEYSLVNFDSQAKQINFNNPDRQRYFYQMRLTGFNTNNPTSAENNGLEVFREYQDTNHNQIQQTTLGSEIEAHIQFRALSDQTINNVAIVDLLPGGFEVVPNSVSSGNCDYVDIREDRVIFYCSANDTAQELTYHLRAVNKGTYTTPPILAQSMYNQTIQSIGTTGQMIVQ